MALTLQQLEEQRDNILAEMGRPSRVEFESRAVTFRPQAELEGALKQVEAEIAKLQSPQSRQFTIQTNRGI